VVAVVDARRPTPTAPATVLTRNASVDARVTPADHARRMEHLGAGEILVNSIDRDGMRSGYDLDLVQSVRDAVGCPITALGGAGSLAHLGELFKQLGIIGASAGSLFVFKGVYKAVLISYPNRADRDRLVADSLGADGGSS
jgi:cyclase